VFVVKMHFKFNNGLAVPAFGLGTWLSNPGEVGAAVKVALQEGYKHIDCASAYGNEAEIGQAFTDYFASPGAAKREDIFVTSKLWVKSFSHVKEHCKKTLKDLQLKYLDLYLIHLPYEVDSNIEGVVPQNGVGLLGYDPNRINEVWKAMESLVEEGLVKSIGVSNFTMKKLDTLLASSPKILPVTNQVELHPFLPQNRLFDHHAEKGILLTAYTPLGGPGRTGVLKRDGEPDLLGHETVAEIAKKNNATPAQVLFAWAIQRNTIVIPKSTNEKRIKENYACNSVKLNDEDMAKLNGIETRFRFIKQFWAIPPGEDPKVIWDGEHLG
jgi:alcohol dehydrogenase (NADP+)